MLVLNENLEKFKTKIINNEFEEDSTSMAEDNIFIHQLTIKTDSYSIGCTLGNLIQSLFCNKFVNNSLHDKDKNLTFIGYNMPHPLDNSLIIKLQFNKIMDKKLNNFIIDGIDDIQFDLNNIIKTWFNISKLNEDKNYAKDLLNI
jgi:DNA-directed RNA polymerase subunit L